MLKNNFKTIVFIFATACFLLSAVVFLLPSSALAQTGLDVGTEPIESTIALGSGDPRVLAARIIQIALGFLGIIAVGLVIYGGFLWMTSGGSSDTVDKAKTLLKNAVIGLVIILMSFAIASFVLRQLLEATGAGSGGTSGSGGAGGSGGGFGAIGDCLLANVTPEPGQNEVARNASLFVSFRDVIDPASICDKVSGGVCASDAKIKSGSIKLFKNDDSDKCIAGTETACVTNVGVVSLDNKTFILRPGEHLGSASGPTWYTARLSNSISTASGDPVFSDCSSDYFNWSFEVSDEIDQTPPMVKDSGVFPPPDNVKDTYNIDSQAIQAGGSISVNGVPDYYEPAVIESKTESGGVSIEASIAETCDVDRLQVNIANLVPTLTVGDNTMGHAGSGANWVQFEYCNLRITTGNSPIQDVCSTQGCEWVITARRMTPADLVSVGNENFVFVNEAQKNLSESDYKKILVEGKSIAEIAATLNESINKLSNVESSVVGNVVNIKAISAGTSGNNIKLNSNTTKVVVAGLAGGTDAVDSLPNDKPDQPKNTVIQINFNESIFPITVVGDAEDVSDTIEVVCKDCTEASPYLFNCGANEKCVKGKFELSNQQKTLEFVSNNKCFVSPCGDDIYCLPGNSNIEVRLKAASLFTCGGVADCSDKTPFNKCADGSKTCQTEVDFVNYPTVSQSLVAGIVDSAMNSFDGDRDANAEGPISFYNENTPSTGGGDNFKWSFYISDHLETDPPKISALYPGVKISGVNLGDSIEITFDKVMMSSTLRAGSEVVKVGNDNVTHQFINLTSHVKKPLGYWVSNELVYSSGFPIGTVAEVKHSLFADRSGYNMVVGSGLKNIYQICYNPSSGGSCIGSPSCCNGEPGDCCNADGTPNNNGTCP